MGWDAGGRLIKVFHNNFADPPLFNRACLSLRLQSDARRSSAGTRHQEIDQRVGHKTDHHRHENRPAERPSKAQPQPDEGYWSEDDERHWSAMLPK